MFQAGREEERLEEWLVREVEERERTERREREEEQRRHREVWGMLLNGRFDGPAHGSVPLGPWFCLGGLDGLEGFSTHTPHPKPKYRAVHHNIIIIIIIIIICIPPVSSASSAPFAAI